jgi:uncharacterized repeat protein (TIGR01451 family)
MRNTHPVISDDERAVIYLTEYYAKSCEVNNPWWWMFDLAHHITGSDEHLYHSLTLAWTLFQVKAKIVQLDWETLARQSKKRRKITMKNEHVHHKPGNPPFPKSKTAESGPWKFAYWALGIGSMIWLLLRSGTKPRRLAYPCQRVAAVNSAGFLAYLATLLGSAALLRHLKVAFTPARLVLFVVGLLLTTTLQASITAPVEPILADSPPLPGWTSPTAVSDVFVVTNVPEPQYSLDGGDIPGGISADEALHDDGVDALINSMEAHGDYFYETTAHPNGLFAADDVIVIKVNNQWDWRDGTNTDVVKGVIYRLVQHPDGFTGAVIVAENPQGYNDDWYHQPSGNNSQFQDQSYLEVVQAFAGEGYHVCIADWKSIRSNFVPDYDAGHSNDGYVLDTGDIKLSYPKFGIDCNGTSLQISMRYGLWNGTSFDDTRLRMINMPVLKRHNAAWATIAVKNYLGFITTHDGIGRWIGVSEMHCWLTGPSDNGYTCTPESTTYGLIGRQMAYIRRADLDIVDAIWVNPNNNLGGGNVRQDVLLASRDPFAVDYYASDYILGPLIHAEHPSHDYQQAMASTRGGWFRNIQLRNVARLRTEGITNTINMDDSMTIAEELAQFNVYVTDASAPMTPTLTLLTPNGGEVWDAGMQQQVMWTSSGDVGDVRLDYSTDGFVTPVVITASTTNTGVYTWTIPNDPSDTVLVRVSSTLTGTISDTSDGVFTITFVPPTPTLTLQSPNGGEVWTVGTQQRVEWASANLEGDVRLDYSTDGFASSMAITDSTANDGVYDWTVPADPSASVLVRVSSTLSSTISDTSDMEFTIAGPHMFDDSYKTVSHRELWGGERITYTIVLYEAVSATLTLTDAIPAPLTYVPGSANVEPSGKGTVEFPGYIRWSGIVTGTVPVTITFQVDVPVTTTTVAITNHAWVSRDSAAPVGLTATSFLNALHIYLPMVLRSY